MMMMMINTSVRQQGATKGAAEEIHHVETEMAVNHQMMAQELEAVMVAEILTDQYRR